MKIIDLSLVAGSDTLCEFELDYGPLIYDFILDFDYDIYHSKAAYVVDNCRIAENIWQSTANDLVIPKGLICDVETIGNGTFTITKNVESCHIDWTNGYPVFEVFDRSSFVSSIKVIAKEEGYQYEWEAQRFTLYP